MAWPSGTFTLGNPFLFSYVNSNQTQIGEQNVVKETVGLDLGKSSNKKYKKLRSDVWDNFVKYTDENGKDVAKCNICKKPFNGSSEAGTTHLRNHFKSCSLNKKNKDGGSASGDKPAENLNQTQEISRTGEQNVVKEMVGLDLGKSSNKKQKKLRSEVWNNFEKYTDENGKDWAKCNICEKKFDGSSKMGTTHLKNHFKFCSNNKKNEGGGSGSGDKPAEDSVMDQYFFLLEQLNRLDKSDEGGGSGSGDKPAEDSVMDQQLNHLDKSDEGGGSGSGDKPAEDSVMDQQLNHLDKSDEGGGSGSGDKPAEDSVMDQQFFFFFEELDQQLSHLDKSNEGGGSGSGDKPAEDSLMDQQLNHLDKSDEGGGSGSGDKPAEDSVMDQQLNHLDKSDEGGGSGSGDKPAEDSVMDQQLSHLDKSNEGGGSGSGDKPAEDSVMDQQLNRLDKSDEGGGSGSGDKPAEDSVMDHLDRVKMLFKQCSWLEPLPTSIETADIINVYNEEKEKLRIYFENLPCRLSLVINTNLLRFGRYLCFSVHFIDDDWKLKKKIISLKCRGGVPIMKILKNVLSEWGIDNKISYMVLDGYSYKNVLSYERENWFSSQGSLLFNGKLFCICDFNYILSTYSDCIDGIENVIYYRMKKIFEYITGNEKFWSAIDRARSLGKKVTTGVIPTEQDLEDWRVVDLIEMGLGLKEAFFELENMEIEFKSINLTTEEWDAVMTFCDLNVETADQTFGYGYKTLNVFFPWLCSTYWTSVELVKLKPFIDETESLHSIRDRMKCWYDDNLVLAVAAVLDPRFKMDVVKHWYKKIYGDEYETRLVIFTDYLTSVYNEYAKCTNDFQSSASGSKETKSVISYEMLDPSGKPCKFSRDHLDHHQSPNSELHLYLEDFKFPLIRDFNILEWWRLNTQYFPTLARMARDFLSIQIITPNSYMNHRDLYSNTRFEYESDMVKEAFICSRYWLKSYKSDMVKEVFICSRESPDQLRRRKKKMKKTSRRPDQQRGGGRDRRRRREEEESAKKKRRRRRRTSMEEQIKEEESAKKKRRRRRTSMEEQIKEEE